MKKNQKEKILRGILWALGIIALILLLYGIVKMLI
jgi:hypothetical protein